MWHLIGCGPWLAAPRPKSQGTRRWSMIRFELNKSYAGMPTIAIMVGHETVC